MKKCPFCAELIQDEAVVCRYCGRELDTNQTNNKNARFRKILDILSKPWVLVVYFLVAQFPVGYVCQKLLGLDEFITVAILLVSGFGYYLLANNIRRHLMTDEEKKKDDEIDRFEQNQRGY